jgi:ParB family chromosome partitioning protein
LQNRAIAAKREALLKAGWDEVVILEIGQRFASYEHVKVAKRKGGKVFITVSPDGAVEVFEGYLSQKELRKREMARLRDEGGEAQKSAAPRPAMTKAMENYCDLHRHALVRLALIGDPRVAWRLAVAHMVAPSGNWAITADAQMSRSNAIKASLAGSAAQAAFDAEERAVYRLLGWDEDDTCQGTARLFAQLLTLSDAEVGRIATFFTAASIAVGSDVVAAVGQILEIDPRAYWRPDDVFFDLLRDRVTINAVLAEVAGEAVAKANIAEKAKTQKQIIRDCLAGTNGRMKVDGWLPGWLAFPAREIGQDTPQPVEPERIAAE